MLEDLVDRNKRLTESDASVILESDMSTVNRRLVVLLTESARLALIPLLVVIGSTWQSVEGFREISWLALSAVIMLIVFVPVALVFRNLGGLRRTIRPFFVPTSKSHSVEFISSALGALLIASLPVVKRLLLHSNEVSLTASVAVGLMLGIIFYSLDRVLAIAGWRLEL